MRITSELSPVVGGRVVVTVVVVVGAVVVAVDSVSQTQN